MLESERLTTEGLPGRSGGTLMGSAFGDLGPVSQELLLLLWLWLLLWLLLPLLLLLFDALERLVFGRVVVRSPRT